MTTDNIEALGEDSQTVMSMIFKELEQRGIAWAKDLGEMSENQWTSFERLTARLDKLDRVISRLNSISYGLEKLTTTIKILNGIDPKVVADVFNAIDRIDDHFNM